MLGAAKGQPAFQVFGISLILLVWINYFSRVTLYAAAWAHAPELAARERAARRAEAVPPATPAPADERSSLAEFGSGLALGVVGVLGWNDLRRRS